MRYTLIGEDDDPVSDIKGAVGGGGLGAERLDDAGDLKSRVEGGVAHALVRRAVDGQVEGPVRRVGRERREGRVAVEAVAGAGTRHANAGAARRHLGHRNLKAEHAVLDGRPRRLDANLPAQLAHRGKLKQAKTTKFTISCFP